LERKEFVWLGVDIPKKVLPMADDIWDGVCWSNVRYLTITKRFEVWSGSLFLQVGQGPASNKASYY